MNTKLSKLLILSVVLLFSTVITLKAQAQEKTTPEVQSFGKVSYYDLLHITGGYEFKIAPQMTFSVEGGGGFDFHHSTSHPYLSGGSVEDYYTNAKVLIFKSNVNYYYNYKKRVRKKKKTAHNAANFITIGAEVRPMVSYMSKEEFGICKYQVYYGAWGMRRNLWKNWNMQFELGLGVKHEYERKYDYRGGLFVVNLQFSYNF